MFGKDQNATPIITNKRKIKYYKFKELKIRILKRFNLCNEKEDPIGLLTSEKKPTIE